MISQSFLPIDFTPGPYDVIICARGKDAKKKKNHEGNKKSTNNLFNNFLQKYASVNTKYEKSIIVSQVIDII